MKQALADMKQIAENMEDWALYAGDYFTEKHDLNGDITHANEAIERLSKAIEEAEKVEPFGWYWNFRGVEDGILLVSEGESFTEEESNELEYITLYTAPPQREWVGLTKDEVDSWELPFCPTVFKFAQFVEAKLKEKNT
jgi:hypothetical protein